MSTATPQRASSKRKRLTAPARRELIETAATEVFAERGYRGASIDEIARRSGVSAPVVYDHFASKEDLHRRLLERTSEELLEVWREYLFTDEPAETRIPAALDAWARYVESHPYAARMFFRDMSGVPELESIHRQVMDQGRAALARILGGLEGAEKIAGAGDPQSLEMASEVIRGGLTSLAVWWSEHPDVAREQIVATAVNAVWIGFERVRRGEGWQPPAPA